MTAKPARRKKRTDIKLPSDIPKKLRKHLRDILRYADLQEALIVQHDFDTIMLALQLTEKREDSGQLEQMYI